MRPLCIILPALLLSMIGAITPQAANIRWLEKDYDFGLMKEAAGPATGSVRFVNEGRDEVVVTGARPSCGCTSVDFSDAPVAPGDTAVISFTYDPAGRPGKFDKSIRVYIGQKDVYRIGIKGNVLGTPESLSQFYPYEAGALRLSDVKLSGGEIRHGSSRNFFINAYNQSRDSITPEWKSDDPALKISCSEKKMGPGDIATFSIFFNSGEVKEIGEYTIPILLKEGATEEAATIEATLNVKVVPDFSRLSPQEVDNGPRCYLVPDRLDLGIISDGKAKEAAFNIQNQGKMKMNVLRIVPKDEAVAVKKKPTVIKPGKTTDGQLSINPAAIAEGPFRIEVEVITDDPLHPIRSLFITGIKE